MNTLIFPIIFLYVIFILHCIILITLLYLAKDNLKWSVGNDVLQLAHTGLQESIVIFLWNFVIRLTAYK